LLAGISGTGKSRIVRQLARACDNLDENPWKVQKPKNFEMIQVKPNWHDSSELLGYVSRIDGEKYVALASGEYVKYKDTYTNNYGRYAHFDKPKYTVYKTGGLADFTGPAWLDGTKSKPEIVLNQQDSANFLVLRDILSDILNGTSGLSKTDKKDDGGDNYYDIEINVESLGDDYDVEQLADKVRGMIYDDATYRNVNAINK
jgi:hypothetical protein